MNPSFKCKTKILPLRGIDNELNSYQNPPIVSSIKIPEKLTEDPIRDIQN